MLTERVDFHVESVIPKDAGAELKPPLLEKLDPLPDSAGRRWPWVLVGLLVVAGVAAAVGFPMWSRWRQMARRRSAYEIARGRLEQLLRKPRPTAEKLDVFFVELSGIVRRYLEDRFELRAPELTTEEFLGSVSDSPDLTQDHQMLLREFLRQADLVKFAGVQPSGEDVEQSIGAARRFLEETRDNAPLIEEPAHV